jgi:hypothetical protein
VGDISIVRKEFLDRVFAVEELGSLIDMLCQWYLLSVGGSGQQGQLLLEARIYCFPRSLGKAIADSLSSQLSGCQIVTIDPDELRVFAAAQSVNTPPSLEMWHTVLSDALTQGTCVRLRATIAGQMRAYNGGVDAGQTTFVFCGSPCDDSLLAKAIWKVGFDESFELVYRHAKWEEQDKLLEAFEIYFQRGVGGNDYTAAKQAMDQFGPKLKHLFRPRRDERRVMRLTRHLAELPDDRGPLAFLRRLGIPLLIGICAAAIPFIYSDSLLITLFCVAFATCGFFGAGKIAWKKMGRVRAYYKRMRRGLGMLYAKPIDYQQIDLSNEKTATFLKCSSELESLGARRLCDFGIHSVNGVQAGSRVYTLDDITISLALLRQSENLVYFPPRPIMLATTRFENGKRHTTINHPIRRKISRPGRSVRCFREHQWAKEVLEPHQKHVNRMIAEGNIPKAPCKTAAEEMEQMRKEHEEARELWKKKPYSWGDAIHDAFKYCRREYLRD